MNYCGLCGYEVQSGGDYCSLACFEWAEAEFRSKLAKKYIRLGHPVSAAYHARKAAHAANIAAERDRSGVDLPEVQW